MTSKLRCWHFAKSDKKLRYGDNRQIRIGRTHKIKGEPVLCEHGLHGSRLLIDALSYAPGPYLFEVELGGIIIEGDDKAVATERTYIRGFNANKLLREFARMRYLINIKKIKGYTTTDDYALIKRFLSTGDESIRLAAESAAREAESAAGEAAGAAYSAAVADSAVDSAAVADSAVDSAAVAAWEAARAAWVAAGEAARAAYSAARVARSEVLASARPEVWLAEAKAAAGEAARVAAGEAARAERAEDKMLTDMVMAEFRRLGK